MKDHEFIELLNLYLDHEISEVNAARLEAEVQRNPARYQVYREYCRMHKACTLLSPVAIASEAPVVVEFANTGRRWGIPVVIGSFMAAAACAAFLFLNRARRRRHRFLEARRSWRKPPRQPFRIMPVYRRIRATRGRP
jgi:hypothetical protein